MTGGSKRISGRRVSLPGTELIDPFAELGVMSDFPGASWLAHYRDRVNADPELKVIGDWFTTTFSLAFGDSRYAITIDKGRIVDIVAAPRHARPVRLPRAAGTGASF